MGSRAPGRGSHPRNESFCVREPTAALGGPGVSPTFLIPERLALSAEVSAVFWVTSDSERSCRTISEFSLRVNETKEAFLPPEGRSLASVKIGKAFLTVASLRTPSFTAIGDYLVLKTDHFWALSGFLVSSAHALSLSPK